MLTNEIVSKIVLICTQKKKSEQVRFEKVCLKLKRKIYKFYILFNDTKNVINNFY